MSKEVATGAEVIAEALAAEGVEYFFNLPGNGVYPMLDPLAEHSIKYVLGLHEASVVSIADGYARASGKVPFVNLYMVPGTANALSAIYIAHRDRVPMVITSTQQTRALIGRDAYASATDLLGMVRQFTKWAWEVNSPERLPEAIHRAFKFAAAHPQGPVFLSLPFDLFPAVVQGVRSEPNRPSAVPTLGAPSPASVEAMAARLAAAEGLLFVAGKDAVTGGAIPDLVALAEELGAAVVSEPWAGTVAFPRPHDLGFGEYTRATFDRIAPSCVFAIGARLFPEAIGVPEAAFPAGTEVLALGLDPTDLGRQQAVDVAAVADIALGLKAVRAALRGRVPAALRDARLARLAPFQAELRAADAAFLEEHGTDRPMSIARLATELNRAIDDDTLIVEHGTTSTPMLLRYLRQARPEHLFGTGASVQGWGMPAAIGVQLARPDARVLAIVGDGGFAFTPQALWSAAKYQLPVTILVINNKGYRSMRSGVLRSAQRALARGVDFGFDFEVDLAHAAAAFGVTSRRVEDPAEIAAAVRSALQSGKPSVIEAVISPNPFPWI
ncbi:MAG TPA: thiamine pyrophosphate-binding protein [Candidatus Limnocylindria bacterium]|nr:thiamine pyrophosphate-binding protein [Candidatus Limnocylindria bacterium]